MIFSTPLESLSISTLIELANWSPHGPSHIAPGMEMKRRQSSAWARISACGTAAASNRFSARSCTFLSACAVGGGIFGNDLGHGGDDNDGATDGRLNS
jgi:hypothetical protein